MKKVLALLFVAGVMAFASCAKKAEETTEVVVETPEAVVDSTTIIVDSAAVVVDTTKKM